MVPVTYRQAKDLGNALGVDWNKIDVEEFMVGMHIEWNHGKNNPKNTPFSIAETAVARIAEIKDFYSWLTQRK